MYCPKCGWNNSDDATKCANCAAEMTGAQPQPQQQPMQQMPPQPYGQPPQQYGAPQPVQNVPDYLLWSILVTIFCCLPFGIVAIVKAAAANGKKNVGDYYGAMQDAAAAKTWVWWSFGVGLALDLLVFVGQIIAMMGMAGSGHRF